MEFSNLKENFTNKYPSTGSYSTEKVENEIKDSLLSNGFNVIRDKISNNGFNYSDYKIKLQGIYSENSVYFDKVSIENKIKTVPNTSLNFVVKLKYNGEVILFTSPQFLNKLQATYQGSNPYKVLSKLSEVVEIDLEPFVQKVIQNNFFERELEIDMNLNVFVSISDDGNEVDVNLPKLIEYINWVVSKPSNDVDNQVLDVQEISDYTYPIKVEVEEETDNSDSSDNGEEQDTNGDSEDNSGSNDDNNNNGSGGDKPIAIIE